MERLEWECHWDRRDGDRDGEFAMSTSIIILSTELSSAPIHFAWERDEEDELRNKYEDLCS